MLEAEGMTCKHHCWETVCVDFHPHCTVHVEACIACGRSRKVILWADGDVEHVYNGYDGWEAEA